MSNLTTVMNSRSDCRKGVLSSLGKPFPWMMTVFLFTSLPGFAAHPKIVGTPANTVAEEVFHTLISTPLGRATPTLPYEVILIRDRQPNAFSNPAGKLYVTSGILPILSNDRGAWAAALGHEIGHIVINYQEYLQVFRIELQKAYLQARANQGDDGAASPLLAVPIGGGFNKFKRSREMEYEADLLGLMIMAEAGYHPDYAIDLDRRLRSYLGDQPKFIEFLSGHPRWQTRQERMKRAYDVALAIFESRWPDPAQSPGGNPPAFGTIRALIASQNAADRTLTLRVPINVHNAAGRKVRVEAIFLDQGRPVQGTAPYQSRDGSLVLNSVLPDASRESAEILLRLPGAALAAKHRKMKAVVFLVVGDEVLDIFSKPVDIGAVTSQGRSYVVGSR